VRKQNGEKINAWFRLSWLIFIFPYPFLFLDLDGEEEACLFLSPLVHPSTRSQKFAKKKSGKSVRFPRRFLILISESNEDCSKQRDGTKKLHFIFLFHSLSCFPENSLLKKKHEK